MYEELFFVFWIASEEAVMNVEYFNENVKPLLKGYCFRYSSFANGDFGDLERIEFEGFNKVGGGVLVYGMDGC
ncbi:hypothetical protein ACYZT2_21630 [Pseudomonas sp. MDT1-85]